MAATVTPPAEKKKGYKILIHGEMIDPDGVRMAWEDKGWEDMTLEQATFWENALLDVIRDTEKKAGMANVEMKKQK